MVQTQHVEVGHSFDVYQSSVGDVGALEVQSNVSDLRAGDVQTFEVGQSSEMFQPRGSGNVLSGSTPKRLQAVKGFLREWHQSFRIRGPGFGVHFPFPDSQSD